MSVKGRPAASATAEAALIPLAVEERRGANGWHADTHEDRLALECPVALVYNGISHAVMMVLLSKTLNLLLLRLLALLLILVVINWQRSHLIKKDLVNLMAY